jgi:hypothetical protein
VAPDVRAARPETAAGELVGVSQMVAATTSSYPAWGIQQAAAFPYYN